MEMKVNFINLCIMDILKVCYVDISLIFRQNTLDLGPRENNETHAHIRTINKLYQQINIYHSIVLRILV